MSATDLGGDVVALLPTGTVTLLLADVEGSTRLWETQPALMTDAVAQLDRTVTEFVDTHHGVRPVEQGEGDSFVVAFGRASDAVACALDLQQASPSPIKLRIGVHTGEVQLRDEGNYVGSTVNRAARLRDLAHGGQTVLSGVTEELVADTLPTDTWLLDLGTHTLRDLPRPMRVVQLCHPELHTEFPPLRGQKSVVTHNLPTHVTSFVGRSKQLGELTGLLETDRLITLTGAGGAGKTRLAIRTAAGLTERYRDGICYIDLAPVVHAEVVAVTAARALGLPDQPGRSTMDNLLRFVTDKQLLILLDNCEHLLDACASLVTQLLEACPGLTVLATSREPIALPGEVTFPVPSLSLADEAVELFTDRARLVCPDFGVTQYNATTVAQICQRLDGMPLAIELAAARVRALSPDEILDSLHDRFRLLTGSTRTAVRRQQTLRASVDWSHALLTEPERVLFRRLAVFLGGFDLEAARAVAAEAAVERYQVLDELTLLVDKSLVITENASGRTRYRLLETMRQYALEKLGESGESDTVRNRHRDHYAAIADILDTEGTEQHIEQAEIEIDNLRGAYVWSMENSDIDTALMLASSLQPLWRSCGRLQEGLAWLDTALNGAPSGDGNNPAARARALADKALMHASVGSRGYLDEADEALALARRLDDPALLIRALIARGSLVAFDAVAHRYFDEAQAVAREIGDSWRLCQILMWQASAGVMTGDLAAIETFAEEGRALADQLGDRVSSRACRWALTCVDTYRGEWSRALSQCRELVADATATHDVIFRAILHAMESHVLTLQGNDEDARLTAEAVISDATEIAEAFEVNGYDALGLACLAAGDATGAWAAFQRARSINDAASWSRGAYVAFTAMAALCCGELAEARGWADHAVSLAGGCYAPTAYLAGALLALAEHDPPRAEREAHAALAASTETGACTSIPDTLECLGYLAADADRNVDAARLFGAAAAARQRLGAARFKVLDENHQTRLAAIRNALSDDDFDAAWKEGQAMTTGEAIAYAQRGRGERKRPSSGWESLTPAELDVVRLVSEGLPNKDIATRLFVSPRTVQAHLSHVYAKLDLTSRVQLAQEAARHDQ